MVKFILRRALKVLAAPIVDSIIDLMERMAAKTTSDIDDRFVRVLVEYRDIIIEFIVGNIDNIIKKQRKN